jgi:WS/DGAT/MGAT family acyltransferase
MAIGSFLGMLSRRGAGDGREPLSLVDNAWLRMDRPTNLMMICGMMELADKLALRDLKETVRTRMLCFHRFRQRVVREGSASRWEPDPHFDLDWHVRRIALPEGGRGALEEVMGDLISTPLDPAKPMWQFHLIDDPEGGCALVLRIHHCYGDGFALLHVVLSMTDADPRRRHPAGLDLPSQDGRHTAWERILGPATEGIGDALRASLAAMNVGVDLVVHPLHAIDYAKTGSDLLYQAAFIAGMAPDSPTRFKGELGVMKRVAWAEPLSLFEVKALSGALECSVNDVVVSCIAGALRAYLLEQGDAVDEVEVRALVPVNLRPPGPVTELGNRFSLVFLSLPIGEEDPLARVREVRRRMEELRHSQQPTVALGILACIGIVPDALKERVLEALAANASAVVTNVHGPDEPRYLAGSRIARQMFWVPQSGGIGIGVSILSYAGQVSFGVVTDARRVPDPGALTRGFAAEFETLLLTALMTAWPGERAPDAGAVGA